MTGLGASFHWRDALDILLVAALVYWTLLMFRGTRAVPILTGLIGLSVGLLLAEWLDLPGLGWLLGHIWPFWLVALVVLFQPELRRGLTRAGYNPVVQRLGGRPTVPRARVVDEIVTAAEALSHRGVGALLVLERRTGLRQWADLGVPLDALVSADLVVSLFVPASPLHDGAVLVQGDRVVAAGCFLPLSRSTQLERALGTRHRAALGISEETDAVALVVSEQTGQTSLAVEGRIETPSDFGELRRRLAALGGGGAERPPRGFLAQVVRGRPRRPEPV